MQWHHLSALYQSSVAWNSLCMCLSERDVKKYFYWVWGNECGQQCKTLELGEGAGSLQPTNKTNKHAKHYSFKKQLQLKQINTWLKRIYSGIPLLAQSFVKSYNLLWVGKEKYEYALLGKGVLKPTCWFALNLWIECLVYAMVCSQKSTPSAK